MNNTNEKVEAVVDKIVSNEGTVVGEDITVYQTVYKLFEKQVNEQAPKKLSKLAADTPFDDLGMDSLEKLAVSMDLEEHYDLFIPDEDIETLLTVQHVVDYIEKALLDNAGLDKTVLDQASLDNSQDPAQELITDKLNGSASEKNQTAAQFACPIYILICKRRISVYGKTLVDFDLCITLALNDWHIPGAAVAVVKGDQVLHSGGYGQRDIAQAVA